MTSLEVPPAPADLRRERRWTLVSLATVALALAGAGLAVNQLRKTQPPQAAPVDHGPLPASVRAEVLGVLGQYLLEPQLTEEVQGPLREFRIKGRTRSGLAQDFYAGFRPTVVDRLMPLLRPYGEVVSFDIASLDLPPARLRPLPSKD